MNKGTKTRLHSMPFATCYSTLTRQFVFIANSWTQVEAVKSLVRKAGYQGEIGKDIPENKIYCTRYQSSKHRVTYEDYVRSIGIDILEEQHSSSGSCATM